MSPQAPTITEQKLIALAPKVPAVISLVLSSTIIWSFYRDARKRKRLYHRLVFVMSCYGIVFSFAVGMGTSMFPSDTSDTYAAIGTKATCNLQGILVQLTLAVPLYYASLSVYCYVAINANFKDEQIVWIEPWIHGTINGYTVLTSIFIAVTDNINPSGTVCWLGTDPYICGPGTDVPCKRGDSKTVRIYIVLLLIMPVYGMIIVSGIMMVKVYTFQKNMDISQCKGKQEILQKAKKRKTKIIALQGSLYFAAFLLCYSIPVIHRSIFFFTTKQNYIVFAIGVLMAASQSSIFALVYFGLQIKTLSRDPVKDEMSYCANLRTRLSKPQTENEHNEEKVEEVEEGTGQRRRVSFSIFDGSMVSSSPWSKFLIDDILEEDDDEIVTDESPTQNSHSDTNSIVFSNQTIINE